jgi:hypothetical protein
MAILLKPKRVALKLYDITLNVFVIYGLHPCTLCVFITTGCFSLNVTITL